MAREKQHEAGNWEESGFAAGATLRSRGRHLGRGEALQPGGPFGWGGGFTAWATFRSGGRLHSLGGRRLRSLGDVSVGSGERLFSLGGSLLRRAVES